ncbi:MAG: hypothetical protein A3H69_01790 [Candidatus Sungbacteria bacterium RIFCSPLOWO2_02_FULL_47_9]|uniref:Uncharacterized protein n=2 Tax=Parcubacteria group TaxID=1794811 RepID=A0A1G2RS74_9BACT|nr:MAG: hypothetical protein UX72_C0003G0040 [Parcubacteria group bacterium GW2011_GWA2_47_10]OGZ93974.1 MAG: hypothetical protein A2633_00845 [Candidatus Sungbacteria bacterium RIFCSPHIGHO2_01_FULL_47_32]OHA09537.1 MAG: hypothetical protein A3H69_01790 [Candidatus Sungbacteria bacterium RIFCSPLOWO2_02_FULL_47_9]OHA74911.1 MAG: hypothetical protein A3A32_03630 [Candidatus Wildermuthbacteria bacterium RIFCSPLOWO2_01_FULL_48_35]
MKKEVYKKVLFLLFFSILLSFTLHLFTANDNQGECLGIGVQFIYCNEIGKRKDSFAIFSLLILASFLIAVLSRLNRHHVFFSGHVLSLLHAGWHLNIYDPIRSALHNGIIQPRLYESSFAGI